MKRLIISLLWFGVVISTISLFLWKQVQWSPLLIIVLILMGFTIIAGLITLIKVEKFAHIPLLLGAFSFCCLCAILEINYFFIISFLYFIGLMIYFISVSNANSK